MPVAHGDFGFEIADRRLGGVNLQSAIINLPSVDPLFHPLPERLAEFGLEDLARAAFGELLTELDALGDLEPGEVLPAMLEQFVGGGGGVRLEDDERDRNLAPLLVRRGDHGALEHR